MPSFIRKVAASFKQKQGTRLKGVAPFVIGTESRDPRYYRGTTTVASRRENELLNKNWCVGKDFYWTNYETSTDSNIAAWSINPQWDGTNMFAQLLSLVTMLIPKNSS